MVPFAPQLHSMRLPWQEFWESSTLPSSVPAEVLEPDCTSNEDSAELAAGQKASCFSVVSSMRLAVPGQANSRALSRPRPLMIPSFGLNINITR